MVNWQRLTIHILKGISISKVERDIWTHSEAKRQAWCVFEGETLPSDRPEYWEVMKSWRVLLEQSSGENISEASESECDTFLVSPGLVDLNKVFYPKQALAGEPWQQLWLWLVDTDCYGWIHGWQWLWLVDTFGWYGFVGYLGKAANSSGLCAVKPSLRLPIK